MELAYLPVLLRLLVRLLCISRLVLQTSHHGRFYGRLQVGIVCPALGVRSSYCYTYIYSIYSKV
jgi:hypothetical protein